MIQPPCGEKRGATRSSTSPLGLVRLALPFAISLLIAGGWGFPTRADDVSAAIGRGIDYLSRAVTRWPAEKRCFSCHHAGDGARTLYLAARRGMDVPLADIAATTQWLSRPAAWDASSQDAPFLDPQLASIQFASALAESIASGVVSDGEALRVAARTIVRHQQEDGHWNVDQSGLGGSPITYGNALATAMCQRVLAAADPVGHRAAILAAEQWLRENDSRRCVDLAAVLLGLEPSNEVLIRERRGRALRLLQEAVQPQGGWGPTRNDPPEPFDTGVVLWALSTASPSESRQSIMSGREYLLRAQHPDGSWPETTRPRGGESYAHRVSTTAWAVWGLIHSGNAGQR